MTMKKFYEFSAVEYEPRDTVYIYRHVVRRPRITRIMSSRPNYPVGRVLEKLPFVLEAIVVVALTRILMTHSSENYCQIKFFFLPTPIHSATFLVS